MAGCRWAGFEPFDPAEPGTVVGFGQPSLEVVDDFGARRWAGW